MKTCQKPALSPEAKPQVGEIAKVIRSGEAGRRGARWHIKSLLGT